MRRRRLLLLPTLGLTVSVAFPAAVEAAQPNKPRPQASKPSQSGGRSGQGGTGQMYKWVDENGVTHYGQTIPPEYRDGGAEQLNRSGMTVRRIEPASTPEERRALEEKLEREREEKKRVAEQARRDKALVNTYGSAEEIDAARDRNLALPVQTLKTLDPRLKKAQARLAKLETLRDEHLKNGKDVSPYLLEDVEAEKREVQSIRGDMDRNSAMIATIRTRYEADRRRFIELTETGPRSRNDVVSDR
jgi:uncharacterized protein DUF4124